MRTASLTQLSDSHCCSPAPSSLSLDCAEELDGSDSAAFTWSSSDPDTYSAYAATARVVAPLPVGEISSAVRATLADWMQAVCAELQLQRQTYQLALQLTDLYLTKSTHLLTKAEYHLTAVAALLLAAKFEEIVPPKLCDLRTSTGNAFAMEAIKAQERVLACTCEWHLLAPTLYQWFLWLSREWDNYTSTSAYRQEVKFWTLCESSLRLQSKALSLMDAALLDECRVDSKELAAAVLFVSVVSECSDLAADFLCGFEYFLKRAVEIEEVAVIAVTVQYVSTLLGAADGDTWHLPASEVEFRVMISTQRHMPCLSAYVKKRLGAKQSPLSH